MYIYNIIEDKHINERQRLFISIVILIKIINN